MEKLNLSKNSLRKFGLTMGFALLFIALFMFFRHKQSYRYMAILSALFFGAGLVIPFALKPVYILWMKLAFVLGWINTRILLILIFYLVFTPVGLLMRVLGKDHLERKIEKNKASYWKKREKKVFIPADYKRQF